VRISKRLPANAGREDREERKDVRVRSSLCMKDPSFMGRPPTTVENQ
jgi:hypothetical protein